MRVRIAFFLAAVLALISGCGGSFSSGDRVLVSKFLYDSKLSKPERFNVIVFKWPRTPVSSKGVPTNYIKRLWGLPGEILAILFGRVFIASPDGENYPFDDHKNPKNANEFWTPIFRHDHEDKLAKMFDAGQIPIMRKPPEVLLALRRIVYDNDYQAKDLVDFPRWSPTEASGWTAQAGGKSFTLAKSVDPKSVDWLRYRNITRPWTQLIPMTKDRKPELITDFMDYNGGVGKNNATREMQPQSNWVGDLMLECELKVDRAEGEFWMELSKGINRFRARFNLASGDCTLFKVYKPEPTSEEVVTELDTKATRLKAAGNYLVRFANVDAQLTVWVDKELPFGNGKTYPPPEIRDINDPVDKSLPLADIKKRWGPRQNDLEPASLGCRGAGVAVSHVRLWRDTYYTKGDGRLGTAVDYEPEGVALIAPINEEDPEQRERLRRRAEQRAHFDFSHEFWSNPKNWGPMGNVTPRFMYCQPGHFLVLGDNSQHSSDSRDWGTVPERLLLGRALMVYFPLERAGWIR